MRFTAHEAYFMYKIQVKKKRMKEKSPHYTYIMENHRCQIVQSKENGS